MAQLKLILKGRPIWLLVVAVVVTLVVGLLIPVAPGVRGPLVDINDGILLAILAGMGLFVGNLYQRLGKLEDRLGTLEVAKDAALDKLTAAASFINRIGLWLTAGQQGPMPQPPDQILPHIDAELWEQDNPGGTD